VYPVVAPSLWQYQLTALIAFALKLVRGILGESDDPHRDGAN
jgi:hypothetical protein